MQGTAEYHSPYTCTGAFKNSNLKTNNIWILCYFLTCVNTVHILRTTCFNFLKLTGYVMHQQFNIKQLYALPTLYLCVLYLSQNKQRLVPFTS
jgi:hypothetical protein